MKSNWPKRYETDECSLHPNYQAVRKPKSSCIWCWELWFSENSIDSMTTNELDEVAWLCERAKNSVKNIESYALDDLISRVEDAGLLPLTK
jgi:hypothetical protein